ncbi:MAG: PilN domain-containing protein [Oligoflexia bacterium]|nr:PilN domain-containing protein [Oligoflexia bacterium]
MILLVMLHAVMIARVASAESDVRELQTEVDRMKAIAAQAEQAEKLKIDLQTKLNVIKRLKANRAGPVRMLDELAQATPDKLSLTSLDQKKDTLKFGGIAVSNEVISQFLSNLEQSDYFEDVYLNSIEQDERNGVQVKVFSVSARLVVPGVDDEVPEPAKR